MKPATTFKDDKTTPRMALVRGELVRVKITERGERMVYPKPNKLDNVQ